MRLPFEWDVPDKIRTRLSEKGGKQRAMVADGHLLLVLHRVPDPGEPDRRIVYFWHQPNGIWKGTGGVPGLPGLKKHLKEYQQAIETLEKEYHRASTASEYFHVQTAVTPLHRATKHLYQTLQAAREALPEILDLIELRDWAGELDRAGELLRLDVQNALDFKVAQQAEEQARLSHGLAQSGHRLNLLVAFFFPLTALASLFGMNLRNGLEDAPPIVFWVIFAIGLSSGLVIRSLVLPQNLPKDRTR